MAAITADLRLEISQFRKALSEAQRLSGNLMKATGGTGRGLGANMFGGLPAAASSAAQACLAPFQAVGRGIAYSIGFQITKALGQIPGEAMRILKAGMSQQQMEVGMKGVETFEGGGQMIMNALRDRVLRWGGNYQEMIGDVRKFVALGLKEQEALKFYEGMSNIAAGIGLSREDVSGATRAMLQMISKEVVMSEELRSQMQERAIPIAKVLAEKRGQTSGEFWESVKNKEVMPQEVLDAISNMEGIFGKFKGSADSMATTVMGLFARLKAHVEDFRRVIGKDLVAMIEPWVKAGFEGIVTWKTAALDAFGAGVEMMKEMSPAEQWELAGELLTLGIEKSMVMLKNGFIDAVTGLFDALTAPSVMDAVGQGLTAQFTYAIARMKGSLAEMLQMTGNPGGIFSKWAGDLRASMIEDIAKGNEQRAGAVASGRVALQMALGSPIDPQGTGTQGKIDELKKRIADRGKKRKQEAADKANEAARAALKLPGFDAGNLSSQALSLPDFGMSMKRGDFRAKGSGVAEMVVSSLQKIGGGGRAAGSLAQASVDLQKKMVATLNVIATNTAKPLAQPDVLS